MKTKETEIIKEAIEQYEKEHGHFCDLMPVIERFAYILFNKNKAQHEKELKELHAEIEKMRKKIDEITGDAKIKRETEYLRKTGELNDDDFV